MFSGHILLEDELKLHVKFEGNFFKLLRHMHIPGIDMLHSVPEIVWQNAFTPRLVSSVSELYGRGHVMDEVSAHAQGGNVTLNQMYTSLLLQYALGADVFTSYYSDDMPVSEQCAVWDAISFAESNTIGRINGSVLLHYPIETMMYLNKPEHEFIESGDDSAALIDTCSKSMEHAMYLLLNRQIPFLFCDTDTLKIAETKKPELFIIGAGIIEPMLAANAKRLYDGGCRIVYFCETEAFSDEYVKISEFATLASSTEALLEIISENGLPTDGDTDGIAALWTDDTSLLVNSESREKKLSVNLSAAEIIDVFTKEPLEFVLKENRTCFTLPPYAAVLIKRRSNP